MTRFRNRLVGAAVFPLLLVLMAIWTVADRAGRFGTWVRYLAIRRQIARHE